MSESIKYLNAYDWNNLRSFCPDSSIEFWAEKCKLDDRVCGVSVVTIVLILGADMIIFGSSCCVNVSCTSVTSLRTGAFIFLTHNQEEKFRKLILSKILVWYHTKGLYILLQPHSSVCGQNKTNPKLFNMTWAGSHAQNPQIETYL